VVAPTGTVVTMLVAVGEPVIVATVPLNFTILLDEVVLKFVPVMVTDVPTIPVAGLNPDKVGELGGVTTKSFALVAVCPFTSTVITPVVVPTGTLVTILVAVGVPVMMATIPLNFTRLSLEVVLKFVPVIVTDVPMGPDTGLKLDIVGELGGVTVKSFALVATSPFTSTVITPVVAPTGTLVTMLVAVGVPLMTAATPLNFTRLSRAVVLKLVPVIVTDVPTGPDIGLKPEIVGVMGTVTVKSEALIALSPFTSTVTTPVVAPTGTVVTILVVVGVPVIVATTPLNFTILSDGVVLKFVPVMVTDVPTNPDTGFRLVMVGELGGVTVKSDRLVPVCAFTSTEITPVVAPAGTEVTMLVVVGVPVIVATTPLNFTRLSDGVVLKLVPVMVTDVPTGPDAGLKPVTVGTGINVKPARLELPPGVVTETLPEAPVPTTAVMLVGETTLKEAAAVPPKLTAVALVKSVPVKVTVAPATALVGAKDVSVGATRKVNPAREVVPVGVVTDTSPVDPDATTAVMVVGETTLKEAAAVPPKVTAVAPVKFVPVNVTVAAVVALAGSKDVRLGAGRNVNPFCVPVPPGVVTATSPEAPPATTAVMLVGDTILKEVASVPPKLTEVAPEKFVPVMVTVPPAALLVGVKLVTVGAGGATPAMLKFHVVASTMPT
jgi:hypothetical protein